MTFLEALEDYLETNNIGTMGTDMYDSELPFDGDNIIALILAPSPPPNKSIPYWTQTIDVWARYTNYEDGYKKLQDIYDLIHQAENYELDGFHVYLSYSMGMIEDLNRDAERRHLFKVSLGFVVRESSEFS